MKTNLAFLWDMSGGGVDRPPAKKVDFFRQNVKSTCPKNLLY